MSDNQNTTTQPDNISVSYKTAIEEIGKQIAARKKTMAFRTLIIYSPIILLSLILYWFIYNQSSDLSGLFKSVDLWFNSGPKTLVFFGLITLPACITAIFAYVYTIEKYVWADSYFDGHNLQDEQSLKITKKILWSYIKYELTIFMRFYALYFALLILGVVGISLLATMIVFTKYTMFLFLIPVGIIIYCLVYLWLLPYGKLRFVPFVFLDYYNSPSFPYKEAFSQMEKLNQISKGEFLLKAIAADFGASGINTLTEMAISQLSRAAGSIAPDNKFRGVVGKLVGGYTREYTNQITEFGKIIAVYILYRYARKKVLDDPQYVNNNLYNLAE